MKNSEKYLSDFRTGFLLILFLLYFSSCQHRKELNFQKETDTIFGCIDKYDGKAISGKLTYFDGISRLFQNEMFEIDSSGNFKVPFTIDHPLYGSSFIELPGNYHELYLEPGKSLTIKLSGKNILFLGEHGEANRQIQSIKDSIDMKFGTEIHRCRTLHATNIGYNDYVKEQISLSKKILDYIQVYSSKYPLNWAVLNALKKDTYFAPAKAWINFRYDYKNGVPKERDTLFPNFYEDLFRSYPINDLNAVPSISYIDYISNISAVLSQTDVDSLYNYINDSKVFSESEMELLKGFYKRDKTVTSSEAFKTFFTSDNRKTLSELNQRFSVKKLLTSCRDLPKGIGRDLVLSQGICQKYFDRYYIHPTKEEWSKIEELIETEYVLNYLHNLDEKIADVKTQSDKPIPGTVKKLANELNAELIGKYKGKVVYMDFWATWCGPCRQEIPYSKILVSKFKNKDVVFLSLCCRSTEENWKKTIAFENMPGEHLFINDIDFNLLASIYKVEGFPTYVLLDKNGNIKDRSAPRPSSQVTVGDIQKILDMK